MTDRTDSTEFEISSLTCYWKEREFKRDTKVLVRSMPQAFGWTEAKGRA